MSKVKHTNSVCGCGKPNLGYPFPIRHCYKTVNTEVVDKGFSIKDLRRPKKA